MLFAARLTFANLASCLGAVYVGHLAIRQSEIKGCSSGDVSVVGNAHERFAAISTVFMPSCLSVSLQVARFTGSASTSTTHAAGHCLSLALVLNRRGKGGFFSDRRIPWRTMVC
ncbi:MAG: hypothetical protein ACI8PP_003148 [Candidatus Pseudothioglobus sp.]|jgi:hypothetical protein